MENIYINEAAGGVQESRLLLPLLPEAVEAAGEPARTNANVESKTVATSEPVETALDEWAVGSACYMCHTCTNFGVQGAEGRPCAKGLSDLIKRRSRARKSVQAALREGV